MQEAGWPGHERTKDLVKDQSPGSAGNPGYLTTTPLRKLPCACHNKSLRMPDAASTAPGRRTTLNHRGRGRDGRVRNEQGLEADYT